MKIVTVTLEELKDLIEQAVQKAICTPEKIVADQDELIKRKDVALFFKVSLVTLNEWMRKDKIPFYRISSRIFFKRSEVMNALAAGRPIKNVGK